VCEDIFFFCVGPHPPLPRKENQSATNISTPPIPTLFQMTNSLASMPPSSYGTNVLHDTTTASKIPEYLRRAIRIDQMDFDSTLSQMVQLLTSPAQIFRVAKARKMTKNCYARDDPAFAVLQIFFLVVAVVAWGLAIQCHVMYTLRSLLLHVVGLYIGGGIVMTLFLWAIANRFLMTRGQQFNEVRRDVEALYCWDIHTNAFFPAFIILYVLQFYCLPVLISPTTFSARALANGLWGMAFTAYGYVTFLGLLELPFLTKQQVVLYPIGVVWIFLFVGTFLSFNATYYLIHHLLC